MTKQRFMLIIFCLIMPQIITSWWFEIIPIQKLISQNPNIDYQKCYDQYHFTYQNFPLSINPIHHPAQGYFKETFILTIPNGLVQSYGLVLTDHHQYVQEFIWKGFEHNLRDLKPYDHQDILHINGRVAVIDQPAFNNYFHWLTEILCRLALLELHQVDFDYLYVSQGTHFAKETLQLWGIDPNKIITPQPNICIQADQIIIPSLVSNVNFGGVLGACYVQPYLIAYVKEKLLSAALTHESSIQTSKRIFISRKDAPQRKIMNEDDVFALFKNKGFLRYELDTLSVTDQILLFHQAEFIVSPQGTGLANCIFCQEGTKIIELLQGLNDCTFWFLSQDLNLKYTPIKTTTFKPDYLAAWKSDTYMPLAIIKDVIAHLVG